MPTGPVTAESEECCGRRCMYRMGFQTNGQINGFGNFENIGIISEPLSMTKVPIIHKELRVNHMIRSMLKSLTYAIHFLFDMYFGNGKWLPPSPPRHLTAAG
jgi:hypothetical protein